MKKRTNALIASLAILLIITGSVGVGFNLTKIKQHIQYFEENYETKNIDTLSLDIGNRGKTTLYPSNSDQIQVYLSGTNLEKTPIKTNYSKNMLQLIMPSAEENFWDRIDLDIYLLFMEFNLDSSVNLDIYLPESIQNIEVKGTSANLYVDEDISVSDMKIITTSGNVDISELNTDKLTIKSNSGNITLDEITANKTKLEARSGNISLNELLGTIKGEVTSGDISLTNNDLKQEIDFETTSGNIDIHLDSPPKDATIKTKTDSGYVDFDGANNNKKKIYGEGSQKVSLKTSSGAIFVNFNSLIDDEYYDD